MDKRMSSCLQQATSRRVQNAVQNLKAPPLCFLQHFSIEGRKASLQHGENKQCETLLWAKLDEHAFSHLLCVGSLPHGLTTPIPHQHSTIAGGSSPCSQFSCSSNACAACSGIYLLLVWEDSPGTSELLAFLVAIALFWCAVQWFVQVKTLHWSPWNWWSIKVIQTSCTCRLKRCKPLLRASTVLSVCSWVFSPSVTHLQGASADAPLQLVGKFCSFSRAEIPTTLGFSVSFSSRYCWQQHMLSWCRTWLLVATSFTSGWFVLVLFMNSVENPCIFCFVLIY